MTKKDLRTGHIVTLRNGIKYMVMRQAQTDTSNHDILAKEAGFMFLHNFTESLESKNGKVLDIVKVECAIGFVDLLVPIGSVEYETIWEREEPKQMTVAEIEAILGYKVEIISDQ